VPRLPKEGVLHPVHEHRHADEIHCRIETNPSDPGRGSDGRDAEVRVLAHGPARELPPDLTGSCVGGKSKKIETVAHGATPGLDRSRRR
jgi:hypothetical protein